MIKLKESEDGSLFVSTKDTQISAFDLVPDKGFEQREMVMAFDKPCLIVFSPFS